MPAKSRRGSRVEERAFRAPGSIATASGGRSPAAGLESTSAAFRQWPLLVAVASALGLLLGAVMVLLSLLSVSSMLGARVGTNPDAPLGDPRSKGSPNAPVVITEWFDYQCPACRSFSLTREPEIDRLYVATGKVRFVSRNYAFLGPESFLAAEAAQCAADQGRYWDYRKLLLQRQQGENVGSYSPENLKRFAGELGLNQAAFDSCLDQRVHRDEILAEVMEGNALGVHATPTIFINGRQLPGMPTVQSLLDMIEQELAKY